MCLKLYQPPFFEGGRDFFCSKFHNFLIHYQPERVNNSQLSEEEKEVLQIPYSTELCLAGVSFGQVPVHNLNPDAKHFENFNEMEPKQNFVGTSVNESKKKSMILSTAIVCA